MTPPGIPLALGTVPLGNFRRAITDAEATAVVERAWALGVRQFDTAPLYGSGLAETRLGRALRGLPRSEYRISTKVGNLLSASAPPSPALLDDGRPIYVDVPALNPVVDFSADAVRRSFETSLERLGLEAVDRVYLHDPEPDTPGVLDQAVPTLLELRDQGLVGEIGIGGSDLPAFQWFGERAPFDVFLVASRITLLDRSGTGSLLDLCRSHGIRIVAGGVFNSGILASPEPASSTFGYRRAAGEVIDRVARIRDLCLRAGVDPLAAAIGFPARFPEVESVVVGAQSTAEIEADAVAARSRVPDDFWEQLDALG